MKMECVREMVRGKTKEYVLYIREYIE